MATPPKKRVLDLIASNVVNGIDYVEVREAEPTRLYVHFFNIVAIANPLLSATVTGGDRIPEVKVGPVAAADWSQDFDGRPVLRLTVPDRGDFSTYTLAIKNAPKLDPYFAQVPFSFYAFCPSPVDCRTPPPFCPEPDDPLPAIDYLAKDYDSFKRALSDFSAQRFPEWRERAEADFGMVMLEAFSAVGDEFSYLQDRIHHERAIETATERRSLVRLARLVDYEPRPITSAQSVVHITIPGGLTTTQVPSGVLIAAKASDGSDIRFETGRGIGDDGSYTVSSLWNALTPYWWNDADRCLEPGATGMDIAGHGHALVKGMTLLIDTSDPTGAEPPTRELVVLLDDPPQLTDPLYGQPLTRLRWQPDTLKHHHDLTHTIVRGNLVPVTQGERRIEYFAIGAAPAADPAMPLAIERLAANSTAEAPRWQSLHALSDEPLAWLGDDNGPTVTPEVRVVRTGAMPQEWHWANSLLDIGPFEEKFTLEPMAWRTLSSDRPLPSGVASDYDGPRGATLRFGDGTFGELPNKGDIFEVRYRISRGMLGNVAPDTITGIDPAWAATISAASNPFAATGGADAESDEQIRRRAPFAFRTIAYRAVRPEDYNAAAERLAWVQRAGTVFRWTGSWPTVFTTADPRSAGQISRDQHIELIQLLNRYRLAGYECYAPQPRYISLDLQIDLCARPEAFRGDVHAGVREALDPVRQPDGSVGFFHVDNFTLGTDFERSRLEAALQAVPGVAGVRSIKFRRRGHINNFVEMPGAIPFAPGEIFRLDNNASRPERGSYRLQVEGGK
jgi:hypothetical protein